MIFDRRRYFTTTGLFVFVTLGGCGDGKGPTEPPTPVATTVTVSPVFVALEALGATAQFTASVRDQSGQVMSGASVIWGTSNSSVASVNPTGLGTAVSVGTATIRATSGAASGTASLSITQVVASVALSTSAHTMIANGATVQLGATAVDANGHQVPGASFAWSSSNPGCVQVDENGLATSGLAGTATITATSGGVSGTATITVLPPPVATVEVTPAEGSIVPGDTLQLTAVVKDALGNVLTSRSVTWLSGDPSVAAVDGDGTVSGLAPGGPVTIRATSEGESGASLISVLPVGEEVVACHGGGPVVALLVEPVLAPSIRSGLSRFEADLCTDGHTALEMLSPFNTALEVREWLMDVRSREPQLAGVILVGTLPHAYQWVTPHSANPSIPSTSEEVISFQYYTDLDGTFAASPDYRSSGEHPISFDLHTGNIEWEIWVGVLPSYKGSRERTVSALNHYFDKNHAYRTGGPKPPRAFLQVSEHHKATTQAEHDAVMTAMRTGTYAWVPFSTAIGTQIYFDSPPAGLTVDQGYIALMQGMGDFFVQDAHGYWGASGKLTIQWAENNPLNTIFFWSNGCAVGNIDQADNFLSSSLYSATSAVLLAKGSTNNSGGLGNNENGFFGRNVATSLTQGRSLGQALLDHVNVPLLLPWSDSREFHFATAILLGDPTIRLRQ